MRISGDGIRIRTEGWWSVLTLDESCLDMLWPDEVCLLVCLAGATLPRRVVRTSSMVSEGARTLVPRSLGPVWLWAAEGRAEDLLNGLNHAKFRCIPHQGNSREIEMENGPGRRKVGVCERRIEVEDTLVDEASERAIKLYEYSRESQCWPNTGKTANWGSINKHGSNKPDQGGAVLPARHVRTMELASCGGNVMCMVYGVASSGLALTTTPLSNLVATSVSFESSDASFRKVVPDFDGLVVASSGTEEAS